MDEKIDFVCEVRKVQSKKLVSNDIEYSVTFTGSDSSILQLGQLPAETMLHITAKKIPQ